MRGSRRLIVAAGVAAVSLVLTACTSNNFVGINSVQTGMARIYVPTISLPQFGGQQAPPAVEEQVPLAPVAADQKAIAPITTTMQKQTSAYGFGQACPFGSH